MDRVIDVMADSRDHLKKHVLVVEGTTVRIKHQVAGRFADAGEPFPSMDAALQAWKDIIKAAYLAVTHNLLDSEKLAERRLSSL